MSEQTLNGGLSGSREFYIPDDGLRLHAKLDMPSGREKCPLMILLHGLTGNMEERHIIAVAEAAIEAGCAVLRIELYGHGQSDGEFERHNLYKWLNNVLTVTEYAKTLDFVTELYLCGHSQGGLTSILAAGMLTETFRAIIPLSPAIVLTEGARNGNLLGRPFDPAHIPDEFDFDDKKLRGDYVRVAQTLYADEAIRRYKGQVLLIHGDADEVVPVQDSINAAAAYENAELLILPGDTHGYDYHLEDVTAAVKAFLTKIAL